MDDVDGFHCQCQPDFSGDHCHCSASLDTNETSPDTNTSMESNVTCLDISTSLSWTIPPSYQEDEEDDDLFSSIHQAEVSVTVGWAEVTAITADILTSPTFSSLATMTLEPHLGVDIDLDVEMVNRTLLTGTEGISVEDGLDLTLRTYFLFLRS